MRPSLRFLALAVVGWTGLRAATLGVLPGAELFRIERSEAKPPPPILATHFPQIEPLEAASPDEAQAALQQAVLAYGDARSAQALSSRPIAVPVYYVPAPQSAAMPVGASASLLPEPRPHFYPANPVLDEWPLSRIAASSLPPLRASVVTATQSFPVEHQPRKLDRLQMSMWALLRSQQTGVAATRSLSSGGSLGASQAGARIVYNWNPQVSAVLRSSSEVGRRGGEVAGGLRVQPLRGVPVWLTAERRQRLGLYGGGRNAFAFFFEAGVYDRPMPMRFMLDGYLQGGIVGLHSRDRFVDGGLTLTRPVYKQFSAGMGVWGGAQPGVYRVDAGPRVTMRVRRNVKVHVDWRQRLAGNALPGSGPAVTLAGDF